MAGPAVNSLHILFAAAQATTDKRAGGRRMGFAEHFHSQKVVAEVGNSSPGAVAVEIQSVVAGSRSQIAPVLVAQRQWVAVAIVVEHTVAGTAVD